MCNKLNKKNLNERPAARAIVALSLTASLAAFGCTTNRTPGNGDPIRSNPGVGPAAAPTSGITGGSSSGTPVTDPSMLSSSTYVEALPSVAARAKRLPLTPDEAAAVMAGHQFHRGVKVLGPVNPGPANRGISEGVVTGAFRDPALQAAGFTVNNSINSAGRVSGLTNGTGAVIVAGTTDVTGATTAAATTAASGTTVATPTNAGVPVSAGAFAAGPSVTNVSTTATVTPTGNSGTSPSVASSAVPSPTATSGTVINPGTAPTVSRPTTATTSSTSSTTATTAAATTAATTATVATPSRTVISNASGKVTVTKPK